MWLFSDLKSVRLVLAVCVAFFCSTISANAQQSTVTVHAVIQGKSPNNQEKTDKGKIDASDVAIWLKPLDPSARPSTADTATRKKWQLVQHNKSFQPHVLIVPVGSVVDFPNRDPFFHNVFSLFDGKRFDLGLYESGATNSVRFDRLGISFLFCNVHPEMSAVVIAVDTDYSGISGQTGHITIPNVPEGKYELHVWYERSQPEDLKSLTRIVTVSSPSTDLGSISIPENPSFSSAHKNKYGQDYTPPPTPTYSHP